MWQDQVGWIRNKTQKTEMFPRRVGTFKNIDSANFLLYIMEKKSQ